MEVRGNDPDDVDDEEDDDNVDDIEGNDSGEEEEVGEGKGEMEEDVDNSAHSTTVCSSRPTRVLLASGV